VVVREEALTWVADTAPTGPVTAALVAHCLDGHRLVSMATRSKNGTNKTSSRNAAQSQEPMTPSGRGVVNPGRIGPRNGNGTWKHNDRSKTKAKPPATKGRSR
jgi:hypothetical protein